MANNSVIPAPPQTGGPAEVSIYNGPDKTIFGSQFSEPLRDDISTDFSTTISTSLIAISTANGGTVTNSNAQAVLSSGTATNGAASMQTFAVIRYRPGHEGRAVFTATFTTGVAGCSQYMGAYDVNNGFYLGFAGATFVVARRSAGVDTQIAQANWNGNLTSAYTRNGAVEALDFTKGDVYRIRYGLLGNAIINFEVLSPDGIWCLMHQIKFPNSSTSASIQIFSNPMRAEVTKTSGATSLTLKSSSWNGGILSIPQNRIDEGNSTFVPLNSGQSFTGSPWIDALPYSGFTVLVNTDKNGLLYCDYSADALTVDQTDTLPVVALEPLFEYLPSKARFVRIRFSNNSGSNQTYLRIQTILKLNPPESFLAALNQVYVRTTPVTGTAARQVDTNQLSGRKTVAIKYRADGTNNSRAFISNLSTITNSGGNAWSLELGESITLATTEQVNWYCVLSAGATGTIEAIDVAS
jgi:hypothetical protein